METYDAFVSYNSQDHADVEPLVHALEDAGQKVWFDRRALGTGSLIQDEIEKGLRAARACLVCIGRQGAGPWQSMEAKAAIELAIQDKTLRFIPVLLPGATQSHLKKFALLAAAYLNWSYPKDLNESACASRIDLRNS